MAPCKFGQFLLLITSKQQKTIITTHWFALRSGLLDGTVLTYHCFRNPSKNRWLLSLWNTPPLELDSWVAKYTFGGEAIDLSSSAIWKRIKRHSAQTFVLSTPKTTSWILRARASTADSEVSCLSGLFYLNCQVYNPQVAERWKALNSPQCSAGKIQSHLGSATKDAGHGAASSWLANLARSLLVTPPSSCQSCRRTHPHKSCSGVRDQFVVETRDFQVHLARACSSSVFVWVLIWLVVDSIWQFASVADWQSPWLFYFCRVATLFKFCDKNLFLFQIRFDSSLSCCCEASPSIHFGPSTEMHYSRCWQH